MRGARVLVVVGWAGWLALVGTPAAHARPVEAITGCGPAVVAAGPRGEQGAATPVVLVHGFGGGPGGFRRTRVGAPSLVETVRAIPGTAVFSFDYSAHSLQWVTDPAIGPTLAGVIDCLSIAYARPAVVVAHSMGGLATQYAQGQVIGGVRVSSRIAGVVAIGTPFEGAQFLGADGGPTAYVFDRLRDAAFEVCDEPVSARPSRSFCDLIREADTPAVRAMRPDSSALAALPAWRNDVRVVALTGDVVFSIGAFGVSQDFGIGDVAVSVGSATAGASPGTRPYVARCRAPLVASVSVIDASPCAHANEVSNRRILRQVGDRVNDALRRSRRLAP